MSAGISSTTFAPFVPSSIPGCKLWLRSDLGIKISTGVSQWNDQSGNGNNVVQATSGKQPTWNATGGPTGGPCLSFLGSSTQYLNATYTLNQPFERYVVAQFTIPVAESQRLQSLDECVSEIIFDSNVDFCLT